MQLAAPDEKDPIYLQRLRIIIAVAIVGLFY
jgi:hypothetical protein